MKKDSTSRIVLILILLAGLFLRFYGINYGLPYCYHADELDFVSRAVRVPATMDLNPHWFGHPGTTVIYLLAILYGFIFAGGRVTGIYESASDFSDLYFNDPTIFYLSGRIMITLFGIGTIFLLYNIVKRIFNKTAGLIAAGLLALSPPHIFHSKIIRPDIVMIFLVLLVVWFCLDILQKKSWTGYLWAGFFAGLSVATKYPGGITAIVIIAAFLFTQRWKDLPKLLASGGAGIAGIFTGSPFLFLAYNTVVADVIIEARPIHLGATGNSFIDNMLWYITSPLPGAISPTALLLAGIGIFFCLYSRKKENILLLIFPPCFLVFIASLPLRWARWILPVIPFFCIFAAYGLYRIGEWLRGILEIGKRKVTPQHIINRLPSIIIIFPLILIGLFIVIPLSQEAIIQGIEMAGKDTRTIAREWIMEHIPKKSRLLVEKYVPHLPKNDYLFFIVQGDGKIEKVDPKTINHSVYRPPFNQIGKLKNKWEIRGKKIEFVVLSDWYDRYLADSRKTVHYNRIIEMYKKLMSMGTKIYEVTRTPGKNRGPAIRVYQCNLPQTEDGDP